MTKLLQKGEVLAQKKVNDYAQGGAGLTSSLTQQQLIKLKNIKKDVLELEQENKNLWTWLEQLQAEKKETAQKIKNLEENNKKLEVENNKQKKELLEFKNMKKETLPKKVQNLQEIILQQKQSFLNIVNKDFMNDLQELEKENEKKEYIIRNYFNKQFLLTRFRDNKNTYTFKSYFEQLFFDTLYFMYQNVSAKNVYQCEYIDTHTIRIAICTENMTPKMINFYNRELKINIPMNYKMEVEHELQDQYNIDFSMF